MALDKDTLDRMSVIEKEWGKVREEDPDLTHDWQWELAKLRRDGDIEGMKELGVRIGQARIVEAAMSSDIDVALDAAKFLVEQSGHGRIQKVDHNVRYRQLPTNELKALISSKMRKMRELNPDFTLALPKEFVEIIDCEYEDMGEGEGDVSEVEGIRVEVDEGGEE